MIASPTPYLKTYARAIRPEPVLTVSEWADRYRVLDQSASAEAGPWRTGRTPYLREIMDCLSASDSHVHQVVLMKGAQIGATEAGNNWLGYVIHHAPSPMLYVMPTVEMVKRTSKQRVAPLLDSTPELRERIASPRSRDSGNTLQMKEFEGGTLVMTGANSAVGLRSMPARYLFLDEIDAYPGDLDGEGDPIQLAVRRTATFKRNRKIFMPSTPTLKGLSNVERLFLASDQRRYFVPCPECGHYQTIAWARISWVDKDPTTAALACEGCGVLLREHHKTEMLQSGHWRPTATSTDAELRGYHLSALYSPIGWYSWQDAVREFLQAQGNTEMLKTWVNTVLGETWEEQGDSIDPNSLITRLEDYPDTLVQRLITAGVDVQKDRLEVTLVAWGPGEEAWVLDHQILPGDTAKSEPWEYLDDVLREERVTLAAIDSGYNTSIVYEFCARRRYAMPIKGTAGTGKPLIEDERKRRQRLRLRGRRSASPEPVGVDQGKALIFSRLKTAPGHGYIHFPNTSAFDDEYFAQITSERLVTKYRNGRPFQEWVQIRPRNEALDCLVYALAAMRLSGVKLEAAPAPRSPLPPKRARLEQLRESFADPHWEL